MSDTMVEDTVPQQKATFGGEGVANDTTIAQSESAQIDIPEEELDTLANWAYNEIEEAKAEVSDMEDNVVEWERLYEQRPRVGRKDFPWDGASNLVVPIVATAVDTILARMLNSVFGGKDLWLGTGKAAKWVELADPIGKWINWVGTEVMKMYKVCQSWFKACVKTGTGILKLPWVRRKRNVKYKDGSGAVITEQILMHDGPKPENVSVVDFLVSNDAIHTQDIQNCEWVAQRSLYTWKNLKEMENSGVFKNVDKVKDTPRSMPTDLEEEVQENTGVTINDYKDYEVWEVWASYDVDGDGSLEEIVLNIHLETLTVLRAVYNFYRHQERPFHLIRFVPRENSIYGIGIGQMLEDIQEEVSTIHNQRLDNATLSNTTVFKRRKGITLGPEEIYPGAFLDVDEIDDIAELHMGQKHHTLLPEEMHTNSLGEKRTGVSDYTVGRESGAIGSRATATSTLALIQEGNKRFQMTIRDIREALNDIAHQTIMLYQQFAKDNKVMYEIFSDKERALVKRYFNLPPEFSRANILIDTPAISEAHNKDVQKQSYMTLMQIVKMYYEGLMQAFGMAANPNAPPQMKELAKQGAVAASRIWGKVLEAFDIVDSDSYVPDVEGMLQMGNMLEQMMGGLNGGQQQTNQGGGPQTTGGPQQQQNLGNPTVPNQPQNSQRGGPLGGRTAEQLGLS